MRQMSAPVNQAVVTSENPEDILGQFYFAFGQGAGSMRVQRAAISALRTRYYPAIQRAPGPWSDAAQSVLSLVAQVGRLAALLATQAGRTAIGDADFTAARIAVETKVHGKTDAAGLMAGPWCAIQPGALGTPTATDAPEAANTLRPPDAPAFAPVHTLPSNQVN